MDKARGESDKESNMKSKIRFDEGSDEDSDEELDAQRFNFVRSRHAGVVLELRTCDKLRKQLTGTQIDHISIVSNMVPPQAHPLGAP